MIRKHIIWVDISDFYNMYRNLIPVCDMRTWDGDDGNGVREGAKGSVLNKELNMRCLLHLFSISETRSWTSPVFRYEGAFKRLGFVDLFIFIEKEKSSVYFTDPEQMPCIYLRQVSALCKVEP